MKRDNLIIFLTFCALMLILILLVSCNRSSEGLTETTPAATNIGPNEVQISPQAASTLRVEPAVLQPEQIEFVLPGKIQYDDDRYSKLSSPVIGRVTEIQAKLGDRVSKGDPLVAIDSPDVGTAYADYVKANSDLVLAQHSIELARDLYAGKAVSRKDLQQAENDFQKAEAEFVRTKERLLNFHVPKEELDKPLDQQQLRSSFFLRSPTSGTVVERNVTIGQLVGNDPAQNLFTVADLTTVMAVADLSEKDLVRVFTGQKAEVVTEAYPNMKFNGRIIYISDLVDANTGTLKLRCRVDNPKRLLKPEMFVRVSLSVKQHGPALPSVPRSSILHEGDQSILFIKIGQNRFSRRVVFPQHTSGEMVEIRDGLKAGEEVVTEGGLLLENLLNAT
jgi:cobalt-zinc-cadmium efflux system membrane fusion protein